MKVHHIGYAVKRLDKAAELFEGLGYAAGEITEDEARRVKILFMKNEHACVELVAPNGEPNSVDGVLNKNGPTPYHICYEVADMEEAVGKLKENGWMVVREAEAAPAIGGASVVFLYNRHIGMIELVEIK